MSMNQDRSAWQIWKDSIKNGEAQVWDAVTGRAEEAPPEVADARYEICKACPELINLTKQCKKCGCFMALKTKVNNVTCPIGKW
jgi:hypothetical protein